MANYLPKGKRSADWNYGGSKWKLSRSKIELFMQCPRCFYLDNKLGVSRPKMPSFTLNIAVDALLKKEFDVHRADGTAHPLMKQYGIDAVPFKHKEMDNWRENFVGMQYLHPESGLLISGAVDDIWQDKDGKLMIVDYKATSKDGKIETLSDSGWDEQYKRQMEIYQWLFRKQGFEVSDTGYFVYVNGRKDKKAFDAKLEFDVTVIPHISADTTWVDDQIMVAKACLDADTIPEHDPYCEFCLYRKLARDEQAKVAKIAPVAKKPPAKHTDDTKPAKKSSKKPKEKINEPDSNKTNSLF